MADMTIEQAQALTNEQFEQLCRNNQEEANKAILFRKFAKTQQTLQAEARSKADAKAKEESLDKLLEAAQKQLNSMSIDPKTGMVDGHDSAASKFKSILGFQLEAVAIGAAINLILHALRAGFGVQFVKNVLEHNQLKNVYIPYDAKLHRHGIALPAGAKSTGASKDGLYVPLCFDPSYHKVFKHKDGSLVEVSANQATLEDIRNSGYLPPPTLAESFEQEVKFCMSKLMDMKTATKKLSDAEKGALSAQQAQAQTVQPARGQRPSGH